MDHLVRQSVRDRANQRCEYCQLSQTLLPWAQFHIEHVRAKQHRGSDDISNLALACHHCNSHKGPNLSSYDPLTDQLVELYNPRTQDWNVHFRMQDNSIIGLTPMGRATVTTLAMNAPDRIKLRSELSDETK